MATSKLSLPKLELITEDSDTRTMDGTADKKKPTKSFGEYVYFTEQIQLLAIFAHYSRFINQI